MTAPPANGHRPGYPPRTRDWASTSYHPGPSTPLLRRCGHPHCGAAYLDDQPGRDAHHTVFGHHPDPEETSR